MLEDQQNISDFTEPTKEQSKAIKALRKDTVHKICSGQVVLSLAVAVKELVENSIDAGATLIEVKLCDQGLESLEVSDNGSGVMEKNIEGMTAKYHTSKIREFVDLQGVETFGFRGEALSSLCALSNMTITTRVSSSEVGLRIELDHEGKIRKKTPCARQVGTTVCLSNLFATLPVRKREFTRNIKKEFGKMCQILQAYCLVSKRIRIICTNQIPRGSKSTLMSTHGSHDVLSNIQAVFGTKQVSDIVALKSPFGNEGKLTEKSLLEDLKEFDSSFQVSTEDIDRLNAGQFNFEGYISSCSHGCGRSSKDRQYFFVNSRPCDQKNIAKLMNEIYHRYNVQQFPFIYLNVITERSHVDVNLTPDKRQLLINNEKILLLAVKKAMLNTFGKIPSTFKLQNISIDSMLTQERKEEAKTAIPLNPKQRFKNVLSQWRSTGDTSVPAPNVAIKRKPPDEIAARTFKIKKIQEFLSREHPKEKSSYKSESDSEHEELNQSVGDLNNLHMESNEYDALKEDDSLLVKRIECTGLNLEKPSLNVVPFKVASGSSQSPKKVEDSVSPIEKRVILDDSDYEVTATATATIQISIAEIDSAVQAEETYKKELQATKLDRLRFKSEISPSQNKSAEKELQKEISKEMFSSMDVVGQFNLGFIIVKLGADLLIVDQHATDEKYNFEMLQRTTILQNQILAVPQVLEMTAVNEMVLIDHLNAFEKNGFKFQISENAQPTKKVRLLAKPFSKNWEFGKDDIEELIFMLQDAPEGSVCRPSRIRAMFASRACRKSVMIGKALNRSSMRSLINHMGEIEQPWNCPHGRPTMRHLINIDMLQETENDVTQNETILQ